jgi:hypothetical protein
MKIVWCWVREDFLWVLHFPPIILQGNIRLVVILCYIINVLHPNA